jgi:pyruvate,orthophosphate dikinase
MQGKKYVYLFDEGNGEMKDLLGGKGAGLAEMTKLGLPVPPGFTITTEVCNEYDVTKKELPAGVEEQIKDALQSLEKKGWKNFRGKQKSAVIICALGG